MGYFARRIVGYFVFLAVLGFLSTLVVNADSAAGGTLMAGANGAKNGVAGPFVSPICSWVVRGAMRRHSQPVRVLPAHPPETVAPVAVSRPRFAAPALSRA